MEFYDYIRNYNDKSYIDVGDGLISVHTDEKSEVINCNNQQLLELSQDEYCISAMNGCFLICNRQLQNYYILNKEKKRLATINNSNITILEQRDKIAYFDNELDAVCVLDFAGKRLLSINDEFASTFKSAHQISNYIISFEFLPSFEDKEFSNEFCRKCVVINIANNEIILQGECINHYDKSVVADASYFEIPVMFPKKEWNPNLGYIKVNKKQLMPAIKFTLVEPYFNDYNEVEYNRHIEFCDFYGNIVKRTEFSEISNQQSGFYVVKKDGHNHHDCTYGVLDSLLQPLLPCCFPILIIEDDIIKMEEPSWADWVSKELNITSKRFLAKRKNGDSILLPYLYCSCDKDYLSVKNSKLLFAYKYNEKGEYCTGIIDTKGDEVLPAIYKTIHQIHNNLYEAVINSCDLYKIQVLFIDGNDVVKRSQYLKIEPSDWSNYCIVRVYDKDCNSHVKLGVINDKGLEVTPPIYDYIFYPREEKVTYIKNGIAGWINLEDMSTHEYPKYSVIKPFVDGMAVVSVGDAKVRSLSKCTVEAGWWDDENNCPAYMQSEIDDIYGEMCIRYTYVSHKEGMIDANGKIIVEPIYNEIIRIKGNHNYLIVKSNDKYGAINKYGDVIIPIQYSWYETDPYEDYDIYKGLSCVFGIFESNVDFYNSEGELLGTEDIKSYNWRHRDEYDETQNYDYERDTYYALGGDDYDTWCNNGGNLDDMMDGMGL